MNAQNLANSPNLSEDSITNLEMCLRRALWGQQWEPKELHPTEILRRALFDGLTTPRQDYGEAAGEETMALCGDRGLARPPTIHQSLYDIGIHHAALADLLATHLRDNAPWTIPETKVLADHPFSSKCLLQPDGTMVRVLLVSWWNEDRLMAELHSWMSLLPMALYGTPLTLQVLILGPSRRGKRHSAWTRGFLHPRNRKLRFKRNAHYGERDKPFGDNWIAVWREDRDEIDREVWLQAMQDDAMLEELHLSIPLAVPSGANMQRLRTLIQRKTEQLEKLKGRPLPNYSQCDSVINPCPFKECCWPDDVQPSESAGYVQIS